MVFQLDYYAGGQFAGLFTALRRGAFASRGLDVRVLPPTLPGAEAAALAKAQSSDTSALYLGSLEQNCLLACDESIVAVGAMLPRSPLALLGGSALLLPSPKIRRVGAHRDTIEVVQAALPGTAVRELERTNDAARWEAARSGALDAIQVYHTTEPLSAYDGGALSSLRPLCATAEGGIGRLDLGYAQALFGVESAVQEHKVAAAAFVSVLMEGWATAAADVLQAGEDAATTSSDDDAALFGAVGRDARFHAACAARVSPAALVMAASGGAVDNERWQRVDAGLLESLSSIASSSPMTLLPWTATRTVSLNSKQCVSCGCVRT